MTPNIEFDQMRLFITEVGSQPTCVPIDISGIRALLDTLRNGRMARLSAAAPFFGGLCRSNDVIAIAIRNVRAGEMCYNYSLSLSVFDDLRTAAGTSAREALSILRP